MKKLLAILLSTSLLVIASGCKKQAPVAQQRVKPVELTYYRLFDGEDVFQPLIQEYIRQNSHVSINYRKFTDPDAYIDLIINELAEGEGPDIFSMHNTWFTKHRKKLTPSPESLIGVQDFQDTFVSVAANDLILPDDAGANRIYGLPLYIDTLALYYNVEHFEDAVPSRGKPATTWAELQEDVFKLTKSDNSFERFERAGIAMGRSDNILRAVDMLYLLFIQYGVEMYDPLFTEATFASGATPPSVDALAFLTSFALPSSKYYNWNAYLADDDSDDKEITTFARGKVSMIIGYSYLYEQIMGQIDDLDKKGRKGIKKNVVKIAPIPQVEDPETSTEKRDTYASYFAETVSRTSDAPDEAWKFLSFLVSKENLQHYHEQTNNPTSRRDMIEEQMEDSTYGIFAEQIGFAESVTLANPDVYNDLFSQVITDVLSTKTPKKALQDAEAEANLHIPPGGLFPVTVFVEETE
jgi:ABC-type glycerol-3-phosphate transport system substrate-binding protein